MCGYALRMAGYRRDFDRSMEGIEARVIELSAIVAEDLPTATQALLGSGEPVRALADPFHLLHGGGLSERSTSVPQEKARGYGGSALRPVDAWTASVSPAGDEDRVRSRGWLARRPAVWVPSRPRKTPRFCRAVKGRAAVSHRRAVGGK